MSDVNTGLLSFTVPLDLLGVAFGPIQSSRVIVPTQTPVFAFKVRRLNTQYLPRLVLVLNNGGVEIPIRRVGEVFRFPGAYVGGISVKVFQPDYSTINTPLGTQIELLVAKDAKSVELLEDSAVDPWEIAEGFMLAVEQASATFPQALFGPGNGAPQNWVTAKVLTVLISSTIAGVMNIVSNDTVQGGMGGTGRPKRSPTRSGGASTFSRFGMIANGSVGALPAGDQIIRTFIPANSPIEIPLGVELSTPISPGSGSGDGLFITGPSGATIEVCVDWLEQLRDP